MEVFSLGPHLTKMFLVVEYGNQIPLHEPSCVISALCVTLQGESGQERCPLQRLWLPSPVAVTFLCRPRCAVWKSGPISPRQANGRWSRNLKGKRRWMCSMESWFAPAIIPMLTYPWKASLVSSLPGRKTLDPYLWPSPWAMGGFPSEWFWPWDEIRLILILYVLLKDVGR